MAKAEIAASPARSATQGDAALPLFYDRPEVLSAQTHGDLRILAGDCRFAATCISVPLVAAEFGTASCCYPVVFADGEGQPLAVLGLERQNLFVDAEGGWSPLAYTPAYVRRYPFVFVEGEEDFALCIDLASERVVSGGDQGVPLYDDGKPAPAAREALAFCRDFLVAHRSTRAFTAALKAKDLLVPQQADIRLANGRSLALNGWQVVDRDRLAKLDDETVLAWHREGYLELIHHHLASLHRFPDLLVRQSSREDQTDPQPAAVEAV